MGYWRGYYYNHFTLPWTVSGTTWVNRYQKGKTNLDLLEQEIVSGSGINWAYAMLTPFDLLRATHGFTSSP